MKSGYVPDPLNRQATVLVDCQTDIKLIIKNGVLSGVPFSIIQDKANKTIEAAVKRLTSETLQEDGKRSLLEFFKREYSRFIVALPMVGGGLVALLSLAAKMGGKKPKIVNGVQYLIPENRAETRAVNDFKREFGVWETDAVGIPLQEYQKEYIGRVDKALQGLAQSRALDPNDTIGRNSLRNLAEMQVRYERHQKEIDDLRKSGVKLVVCSVHADCSDRCAPYQGRVYSLDGTSGTTADGRKYVPLEEATQNTRDRYTTKAGRTYQNGLLGFNCRHKLYPYKEGMQIPTISEQERIRQDAITKRQRELERDVIRARENALILKGVPSRRKQYLAWRDTAIRLNQEYQDYSKANGRAYYPDRVRVL